MIEIKKMLVTPSAAKELLERNVSNRRVRRNVWLPYSQDMANGRWKEDTMECIKISKSGRILDGQHRLIAVVDSNVPIMFHIAYNLDEEVFDVLDTGSKRNASDIFKIKDIKYESTIPSIISMYNLLLSGRKFGVQKKHKSTNAILLEQYYEDELFWQNVARNSHSWYTAFAKILPTSYLGGFFAFFSGINPNKAESFFIQLTTGIGITNGSISQLRNKLMQDKMSSRKMTPTLKIALIIKTWNLYVTNKSVGVLKFDLVRDIYPIALSCSEEIYLNEDIS